MSSSNPVFSSKGLVNTASLHSPITISAVVKTTMSPEMDKIYFTTSIFAVLGLSLYPTYYMTRDCGPIIFPQHNVEVATFSRQSSHQGANLKMLIIGLYLELYSCIIFCCGQINPNANRVGQNSPPTQPTENLNWHHLDKYAFNQKDVQKISHHKLRKLRQVNRRTFLIF